MRVGMGATRGIGNADLGQELHDARVALPSIEAEMGFERFADLEADGEAGVQRRHRLLKDHRDVLAGDGAGADCATS